MDLKQKIEQQNAAIANLVLEVAAEKQRADQLQHEARKAVAFVQAEQQRYEALAQELAAAKAAIPAQTGMAVSLGPLASYDAGLLSDFGGGNVGWWQDYLRAELERAYEFYAIQWDQHEAAQPVQQPAPVVRGANDDESLSVLYQTLYDKAYEDYAAAHGDLNVSAHLVRLIFAAAPVAAPVAMQKPIGYASTHEIRNLQNPGNSRMVAICSAPVLPDLTVAIYTAPVPAASVQPDDLIGMAVSIDVSTGDDDAGHRLFGTVGGVQESIADKGGIILLVDDPKPNFSQPDSGRDAALVGALVEAGRIYGNSELLRGTIEELLAAHPANVAQVGELSEEFTLALDRAIDNLTRVDESDTVKLRDAHEVFHALYRSVQAKALSTLDKAETGAEELSDEIEDELRKALSYMFNLGALRGSPGMTAGDSLDMEVLIEYAKDIALGKDPANHTFNGAPLDRLRAAMSAPTKT